MLLCPSEEVFIHSNTSVCPAWTRVLWDHTGAVGSLALPFREGAQTGIQEPERNPLEVTVWDPRAAVWGKCVWFRKDTKICVRWVPCEQEPQLAHFRILVIAHLSHKVGIKLLNFK